RVYIILQQTPQAQVFWVNLVGVDDTRVETQSVRAHISNVQHHRAAELSLRREIPVLFIHRQGSIVPPHVGAVTDVEPCVDKRWVGVILWESIIPVECRMHTVVRRYEGGVR